MTELIYKIVPLEDWQKSLSQETLPLSEIDKQDGFIHFSTRAQLFKTLEKHFVGQSGLFALEVDPTQLPPTAQENLKWEKNTPEGDTYPHLYADLPMDCVQNVYPVFPKADGSYDIPELTS